MPQCCPLDYFPLVGTSPPLMSRNACSDKNGKFDEISSNQVNVHGFDNFDKFAPLWLLYALLDISRYQ